jgi:type IV secretion system protein TrbI
MNDAVLPGQAPRIESEPSLANSAAQPMGVIRRNLKMQVYLGIAVLFIIATAVSSMHHKTPANKFDPNTPPSPMVQDASPTNIEEMRREIAKQQQETGRLATGGMPLTVPTQTTPMPYAPNGVPSNGPPGTQYGQETQLTPQQQQALAFDTQEKELAYKARFASNLAYSQSHDIRGSASLLASNFPVQAPPNLNGQNSPVPSNMIAPRPIAQEQSPAEKRPAEVNINSATGQPYVVYEGTPIETILMNRLDGDASGPVKVMVTTPVYSHDHQHVLIPEGSVVLGESRKIGTAGFGQQRRLAVVFHRMIMPDGYSVDLDQFQGLNQIGETGLKDKVNNHYLTIFGTSIALGIIGGAAEMSNNGGALTGNGIDAYKYGVAASMSENATTVLDRFINIPPTITIREGYRVKVYISQDLLLPAYENHAIPQTY